MISVAPLQPQPSLAESLARMASVSHHLASEVGPAEGDWVSFNELLKEHSALRDQLLAFEAERCPGLDDKGQVAFLLGGVMHYLMIVVAPLVIMGRQVPVLTADSLAFRTREVPWQHGKESGTYQAIDWRFADDAFWTDQGGDLPAGAVAVASAEALYAQLNIQLAELFAPLIERFKAISRLSRGAQWRQAADALAGAFLTTGQTLHMEAAARAVADTLIGDPRSPLHNSKTGFVDIVVDHPAKPDQTIRQTYRARGGCCRYYTADSGHLCSTCVLVKPEERDERLRNHLLNHHHD